MTPEEKARQFIDAQLAASGWVVQTKDGINLAASRGVAICDLSFPNGEPVVAKYNPDFLIEEFDFIATDECHRSTYPWQVPEYFDALQKALPGQFA
jgi:type I site-specific restriction endonuclease